MVTKNPGVEPVPIAHSCANHHGTHIGSGHVESGHKVVMQQRMKQAGMRWAEENLNPMLPLRVALCNQTWNTNWREIEARVRQDKYPVNAEQKQNAAVAT